MEIRLHEESGRLNSDVYLKGETTPSVSLNNSPLPFASFLSNPLISFSPFFPLRSLTLRYRVELFRDRSISEKKKRVALVRRDKERSRLEGAIAGYAWFTMLRENYRERTIFLLYIASCTMDSSSLPDLVNVCSLAEWILDLFQPYSQKLQPYERRGNEMQAICV